MSVIGSHSSTQTHYSALHAMCTTHKHGAKQKHLALLEA
jgi:hypothetical protein